MEAIRNSKLFPIITVLCLLLTTLVYAVELMTALMVVAAVASIISLGVVVGEKIHKAIKNRKKDLADLKADRAKLEKKIKKSEDKAEKIQDDIDELDPEVDDLRQTEYSAYLEYHKAFQAEQTAKTNVETAKKAYEASNKAWKEHKKDCSICAAKENCNTEYRLYHQKERDKEDLDIAKRRLGMAEVERKKKRDAWDKAFTPYRKAESKLNALKLDKREHVESHADLLDEKESLNAKIKAKETSIGEAETDLATNDDAQKKHRDIWKGLMQRKQLARIWISG